MPKLFSSDPLVGRYTVAHEDGEGGIILETKQDVSHIVEGNKKMFNEVTSLDKWGDLTHVARLPLTVIDDLNKKRIMRGFAVIDEKAFKAFLNDPDNRFFRTRPGRV
jgi:hypothetical protein